MPIFSARSIIKQNMFHLVQQIPFVGLHVQRLKVYNWAQMEGKKNNQAPFPQITILTPTFSRRNVDSLLFFRLSYLPKAEEK